MDSMKPRTALETHTVFNQPEPREGLALWSGDALARDAIARLAPDHAAAVTAFAEAVGAPEAVADGRLANRHPPELRVFDRAGRRIDEVDFHPAYHAMMDRGISGGYSARAWSADAPGGHVAHAAMVYLYSQVEPGTCCPMTMTYAAVPALRAEPDVAHDWLPGCLSARYDPTSRPAPEKTGLTLGMAMTEKQGGSDLRANTTRAEPDGDGFRLFGHKWFCSAPMSDAFLTLAQTPEGLTCFLAPRWTPDGARNAIHLVRLKDKLGNRSNASAEIEYHGAWARRIGAPGHGVRTILEMVHHTRLDTAMAPAGLMRRALAEAAWWTGSREAFGARLADQPLMQAVLADLALEWMGATLLAFRVAEAFDRGAEDPAERALARLAVALAKYWSNTRCPAVVAEAMTTLGGTGYVEESDMPLLYREAPLNGIWEGAGNVICLDALRTVRKVPEAMEALLAELHMAMGANRHYDAAMKGALERFGQGVADDQARGFVETLALLLQAGLLLRHGAPPAAEAFAATRLGGAWGRTFGTLPPGTDAARIAAML